MSLPLFLAIGTTLLFGILAIYFSIREERLKKELQKREVLQKRRLYEISTLRAIQERIGYSLDIERVIDTLTGSLKNLFPYSTASSLLLEENKLVFKSSIEEPVSLNFIQEVKKSMVASLSTLLNSPLPQFIEETRTGMLPDDQNQHILASFFHIPLVVNGKVVGLINVSSTTPGLYKEEDMTILYQMTNIASNALTKLREVIQTEEEKILATIESLSDGLLFVDTKMQLGLINPAAKKILNLEEKPSVTLADVLPVLAKVCDISTAIRTVLTEGKTVTMDKVLFGNKTLRLHLTPVIETHDATPTMIGTTIAIQDLTLETSLNSLKEDFTNGIVHELRSPLTAIKAGAELLLSDNNLTASQEKLLKIIDEQTQRMLSDINSLLDAAKIDAGKLSVTKHPEDITQVIQEALELFQAEAETKHIILTTNISPNLPKLMIDKTRIEQVFRNLLSNSLKYTPAGGTIQISAQLYSQPHLPQSSTNPGLLVSVSDTGSGIPKEKQSYLFSKFAQVGYSPVPHAQQGTGLGLYISKGIVTAHNGTIFLSSQEGKGTTVSFTLPIAQEQNALYDKSNQITI